MYNHIVIINYNLLKQNILIIKTKTVIRKAVGRKPSMCDVKYKVLWNQISTCNIHTSYH
jgi:hypothetical protein